MSEINDIRPYTEKEALEAFKRIAKHPNLSFISKYLFPDEQGDVLLDTLRKVGSIKEFQDTVMLPVVSSILARTSDEFTVSGLENLEKLEGRKFLAISNHRDIVMDPALIQYALRNAGLPFTQICVGNNLLTSRFIEDIMRSNRVVIVLRGISSRELYLSSQVLSKYIRSTIKTSEASIWIAQREGRTKNGVDTTEQGLLKMFDMSGEGDFVSNFDELNILPISISYEYEPCDARKAREIVIKQKEGSYKKKRNEDLQSILTGIKQEKGRIHITFGEPLAHDEIVAAAAFTGNDRYQAIRHTLDRRIISGYRLYKTNYIAYDMMRGQSEYAGVRYLPQDVPEFNSYIDHKLDEIEKCLDRDSLRRVFLEIYGKPVESVLQL